MTTTQDRLGVEYLDPNRLKPHPGNARTHSRKQRQAIAASIRRFGFVNPVLVDEDDVIIAGHGRVMAAKELELATIPVIRIEHMNEDERRAYVIADNKLAEMAGWDRDILATELQHLLEIDGTLPEVVGFEIGEVDVLLTEAGERVDPDDETLPEVEAQAVSRPGDLWCLGDRHRVLCGDARDGATMAVLMEGAQAVRGFAARPCKAYNVRAVIRSLGARFLISHRRTASFRVRFSTGMPAPPARVRSSKVTSCIAAKSRTEFTPLMARLYCWRLPFCRRQT
jgi:hypothetical protein